MTLERPRLLSITTPIRSGVITPVRLSVTEELGLPYEADVEILATDPNLLPEDLLTKGVTVTITQSANSMQVVRHFNGVVAEFERLGPGTAGRMRYRLLVVPAIWQLGLRTNCRIFQGSTLKKIITTVLADHGLPEPSWGIGIPEAAIPYCTQFNETDLAFVSRLLDEHGLNLYFQQAAGSHEVMISASAQGFPSFVGGDVTMTHATPGFFDLGGWRRVNQARSYVSRMADMDTERSKPSERLYKARTTRTYAEEPGMWNSGEVYRWPGGQSTRPGLDTAEVAMGAQEAASETYEAKARDPRFAPGVRVSVGVQLEDGTVQRRQYVVTAARHEAEDTSGLVAGAGGEESYNASLNMVFAGRVWISPRRHPRPVMPGLQSAIVTGPEGEQIHVDEFGRIKVKLCWDRFGPGDDASSCWVRVMQPAAGAWGGAWFLPRVGDEVLVAFLEGDPDRPLVVGSVYGMDSKPPFEPGTNKSQSGYRTRSFKSESREDANILRFEDKKGSEEVLLHAQKDLTVTVENDEVREIGHDQTITIHNERFVTVEEADDRLEVLKGSRTVSIKRGDDKLDIKQGNLTTELGMGNESRTIKQGNLNVELGMGNETHTIKMGDLMVKCSLGQITMEAMQSITLKVGQNSVVIDQMGVTVKGMMITEEAQLIHKTKGLLVQEEASAMVQIQGGIVLIN
jgi:type VI secretion system secreted protein VgrG